MPAPFIALTMPALHGYDAQPIFINAALVRSAYPRRVRRTDAAAQRLNGPGAYEIAGTFVHMSEGEEGTFAVAESYGEVTGAIRDALA